MRSFPHILIHLWLLKKRLLVEGSAKFQPSTPPKARSGASRCKSFKRHPNGSRCSSFLGCEAERDDLHSAGSRDGERLFSRTWASLYINFPTRSRLIGTAFSGAAARSSVSGHMPSLDGLRALSILMVLLGHLSGTRGFMRLNLGIGDYAHLGVVVFFVISGFLITTLLMHEYRHHGTISLKLFYARRSIRIFPASYGY